MSLMASVTLPVCREERFYSASSLLLAVFLHGVLNGVLGKQFDDGVLTDLMEEKVKEMKDKVDKAGEDEGFELATFRVQAGDENH